MAPSKEVLRDLCRKRTPSEVKMPLGGQSCQKYCDLHCKVKLRSPWLKRMYGNSAFLITASLRDSSLQTSLKIDGYPNPNQVPLDQASFQKRTERFPH